MRRLAPSPTVLALGAALVAGCAGGEEPPDPGAGGRPPVEPERGATGPPPVWPEHGGAARPAPAQRESGSAALLVMPRMISPGESLEVTVDNRGRREILYGLAYTIERRDGERWQTTGIAPRVFPQIGLVAPPRRHGKSQRVQIPTEVEPGRYRIVKRVSGLPEERGAKQESALRGEFRVR